ncbi:hypothetical protein [Rhodopirellula bahusiensis]|uniref:hypothetical protein n=1 Tax=Rhodopirellula bahusiensis TaxID=2014065 RepID=UPI003D662676
MKSNEIACYQTDCTPIKPEEFEPILLAWLTELHKITNGQVIAIDGKTLRRSYDHASGKAAIHMVSAWATANRCVR